MARQVEHGLQVGVARLLGLVLDPARTWWSGLDHAAKLSPRYGWDRKQRGIKAGLPDFLILTDDYGVLGIEIKAGKGRATDTQLELACDWRGLGHRYEIARSLAEVQQILIDCGVPMVRKMNFGRAA